MDCDEDRWRYVETSGRDHLLSIRQANCVCRIAEWPEMGARGASKPPNFQILTERWRSRSSEPIDWAVLPLVMGGCTIHLGNVRYIELLGPIHRVWSCMSAFFRIEFPSRQGVREPNMGTAYEAG